MGLLAGGHRRPEKTCLTTEFDSLKNLCLNKKRTFSMNRELMTKKAYNIHHYSYSEFYLSEWFDE